MNIGEYIGIQGNVYIYIYICEYKKIQGNICEYRIYICVFPYFFVFSSISSYFVFSCTSSPRTQLYFRIFLHISPYFLIFSCISTSFFVFLWIFIFLRIPTLALSPKWVCYFSSSTLVQRVLRITTKWYVPSEISLLLGLGCW